MKRFLFCIVMLFCMCMAMNAQRLKTYSGPYNDSRYMALIPIKMQKMAHAFSKAILLGNVLIGQT